MKNYIILKFLQSLLIASVPSGYTKFDRDNCYYNLLEERVSFNESINKCRQAGSQIGWRGSLAEARTKLDYDFMYKLYKCAQIYLVLVCYVI